MCENCIVNQSIFKSGISIFFSTGFSGSEWSDRVNCLPDYLLYCFLIFWAEDNPRIYSWIIEKALSYPFGINRIFCFSNAIFKFTSYFG